MTPKQQDNMPSREATPKKRKFTEAAELSSTDSSDDEYSSSDEHETTHETTGSKGEMFDMQLKVETSLCVADCL